MLMASPATGSETLLAVISVGHLPALPKGLQKINLNRLKLKQGCVVKVDTFNSASVVLRGIKNVSKLLLFNN